MELIEENCNSKAKETLASKESERFDGNEDTVAEAYINHLLNDGAKEGDSGEEMEMPPWYNADLFKRGQEYMKKYRFVIVSGMLTGLIAVLAIPSILRILICTRQSSTAAAAYRRYVRTILHTNTWYDFAPDDKNSKFWTSLKAVRKAHLRSSKASFNQGAGSITQKDLALTQFGFIGFSTLGAHRVQIYDRDYLEATSHMWRVLGYLFGIKDEYNVCGQNWKETKLRLDIVMRQVYTPALENTNEEFLKMTTALLDGLKAVNSVLTVGSYIFFTKRLAYVKGYEFFDFDCLPGEEKTPKEKLQYYKLNWWDRFIVCYGLYMVTYLYKYTIFRWYLNFRVWIGDIVNYYLPYTAMYKYGIKWSYVRIFTSSGKENDFEFHLKDD